MSDARQALEAWHRAVNAGDVAAADALVSDDVAVGGPRGFARGRDLHRRWVADAGIHLQPVGWHALDAQTIVVEQDATWPGRADADVSAPLRVATRFHLRLDSDGVRIVAILRYDDLAAALAAGDAADGDGTAPTG